MNGMNFQPQMSQRGADGFSYALICENLCHLWFNCFLPMMTAMAAMVTKMMPMKREIGV